jgi:hypothetical protein
MFRPSRLRSEWHRNLSHKIVYGTCGLYKLPVFCMINTLTAPTRLLLLLLLLLVLGSFSLLMHGRQTNRTICTSTCACCHYLAVYIQIIFQFAFSEVHIKILQVHWIQNINALKFSVLIQPLNFKDGSFNYVSVIQIVLRSPELAREKNGQT